MILSIFTNAINLFFIFVIHRVNATCGRNSSFAMYCARDYNCPEPIPNQHGPLAYSDVYVRTRVLPFIGATYADDCAGVQKCLNNNVPGAQLIKKYEVVCDTIGVGLFLEK